MDKEKEEWKDIPEYEGYYQASNLGRVRSLDRWVEFSDGRERFYKGGVIEGFVNGGYKDTTLCKDSVCKTYRFSQLVAMAFLEHEPNGHKLVVDHINGDKADDKVDNLRIVTQRANSSYCFRANKGSLSSEYVGVSWHKRDSRWMAKIQYNGTTIGLGCFTSELEASNSYQSALLKIKEGSFNPDDYKPGWTSRHKGVTFNKATAKWRAQIQVKGKQTYLGSFPTELEAYHAYQTALHSFNK